jgi:hypothetical protein
MIKSPAARAVVGQIPPVSVAIFVTVTVLVPVAVTVAYVFTWVFAALTLPTPSFPLWENEKVETQAMKTVERKREKSFIV